MLLKVQNNLFNKK